MHVTCPSILYLVKVVCEAKGTNYGVPHCIILCSPVLLYYLKSQH
jgi:hypothetical protein